MTLFNANKYDPLSLDSNYADAEPSVWLQHCMLGRMWIAFTDSIKIWFPTAVRNRLDVVMKQIHVYGWITNIKNAPSYSKDQTHTGQRSLCCLGSWFYSSSGWGRGHSATEAGRPGQNPPWSQYRPPQPSLQLHCQGCWQVPLRQPGWRLHFSQRLPSHPSWHRHFPGDTQDPRSPPQPPAQMADGRKGRGGAEREKITRWISDVETEKLSSSSQ